jgi:acetylornithine deacetylase
LNEWAAGRHLNIAVPELYQNNPSLPVLINQLKAGDVTASFFADRVPAEAWLTLWAETYPGMTMADVLNDLQACYRRVQANDTVLARFEPTWKPIRWLDGSGISPEHTGVQLLSQVVTAVREQPTNIQGSLFACDGHMFNLYSPTPMVLLGPTGGRPHSPDEYINIDDYLQLVEIFIRTAIEWCGLSSVD